MTSSRRGGLSRRVSAALFHCLPVNRAWNVVILINNIMIIMIIIIIIIITVHSICKVCTGTRPCRDTPVAARMTQASDLVVKTGTSSSIR